MTGAEKKTWSTPKLRVIVRTRAEEGVLSPCKLSGTAVGPNPQYNYCAKSRYDPCSLYCFDTGAS